MTFHDSGVYVWLFPELQALFLLLLLLPGTNLKLFARPLDLISPSLSVSLNFPEAKACRLNEDSLRVAFCAPVVLCFLGTLKPQ